jgi:outer membrane biosynthesis protein TonB
MNRNPDRNTLLAIPLIEERYGRFFFVSIAFHGFLVLLFLLGGYLLPSHSLSIGGSGPGGGMAGAFTSVGVTDELSGGAGMTKPSLIPQPPALNKEPPVEQTKAISLPGRSKTKNNKVEPKVAPKRNPDLKSNIIPTAPQPGSGGIARSSSGSGGGVGGGIGLSIGPGSGGVGDDWYSRQVAARISQNWVRPADGTRVEMVYSFYISANGTLYNIKKEKSSGNKDLDLTADSALFASYNPDPLPPPKPELRRVKFVARFVYPSDPSPIGQKE